MGGDEEDQWTYVSKNNRSADKRSAGRRRARVGRNNQNEAHSSSSSRAVSTSFAGVTFYSSSAIAGNEKEEQDGDTGSKVQLLTDEQLQQVKVEAQRNIMRIMEELERHPYVMHLLRALTASSTDDDDEKDENEDVSTSCKAYGEIICYGVGNFLPTSVAVDGSYALPRYPLAPMLQLALALVIRQQLANLRSNKDLGSEKASQKDDGEGNCDKDEHFYSKQQGLVRMIFFEPLMTELERTILEDELCVDIIETNERGKRQANGNGNRTLFYMPHCPMRLYSNVLWANWGDSLRDGRVVIYGNNFHGYDDRILSREERTDPTNAVLKIVPHLKTEPINGLMSKPSSGVESDLLVKIENAFNDCVVMIFDAQNGSSSSEDYGEGDGTCWPDRPEEYVFDDEGGDGEVI